MDYQMDTAIFDDEQKVQLFKEIGSNIAKLRQQKELTKHELSQLANITDSTLLRLENGESFSGSCLINIIIALRADVRDVIPLRSHLGIDTNTDRFEYLTEPLDSYEMNMLFRVIEMFVKNVCQKH